MMKDHIRKKEEYKALRYDRFAFRTIRADGWRATIEERAGKEGISVNQLIIKALTEYLKNETK